MITRFHCLRREEKYIVLKQLVLDELCEDGDSLGEDFKSDCAFADPQFIGERHLKKRIIDFAHNWYSDSTKETYHFVSKLLDSDDKYPKRTEPELVEFITHIKLICAEYQDINDRSDALYRFLAESTYWPKSYFQLGVMTNKLTEKKLIEKFHYVEKIQLHGIFIRARDYIYNQKNEMMTDDQNQSFWEDINKLDIYREPEKY